MLPSSTSPPREAIPERPPRKPTTSGQCNIMTGTVSTPATHKALGTVEIIELILQHLDFRDLLCVAQLVCRTWRDVVAQAGTRGIRRALFLDSTTPRPSIPWFKGLGSWHHCHRRNSPFTLTRGSLFLNYTLHPFLGKPVGWHQGGSVAVLVPSPCFWTDINFQWHRLFSLPPGQWQQMFATQPPCLALTMMMFYQRGLPIPVLSRLNNIRIVGSDHGVTLGDVTHQI